MDVSRGRDGSIGEKKKPPPNIDDTTTISAEAKTVHKKLRFVFRYFLYAVRVFAMLYCIKMLSFLYDRISLNGIVI